MKKHLFLLCFLASALSAYVQSKPHEKNLHVSKHNQTPERQHKPESVKPNESKGSILPTFLPFESSTQDPEDEDMSEIELKVSEGGEENTPLLLSEEALTELLQDSKEAEDLVEDDEDDDKPRESEEVKETENQNKEHVESPKAEVDEANKYKGENKEDVGTDIDSSTDSEIPMDLDYASDRDASQPLPIKLKDSRALNISTLDKEVEKTEDVIPTAMDYESQQLSSSEDSKEDIVEKQSEQDVSADIQKTQEELTEPLHDSENDKNNMGENEKRDLHGEKDSIPTSGKKAKKAKKEKKQKNENGHGKGKGKKQQTKQHVEDMQNDQSSTLKRDNQQKQVDPSENTVPKPRKKNGKWSRLVGINPVQIKATMELYPDIRPTHRPSGQEVPAYPCESFHCKRGKTCKMNNDNKPTCVCQEPSACPPSLNEFDHVCGTDNKTYDTSCQLFSTKCSLEGTKKGHRLHLDYTGSCKFIAPCLEAELVQFPLRMRDWLKNVLLQLYEHDSMSPGFLTAKQRIRVQKIYESEWRLHAGDHLIELLLQDFEKNYNMYIYPVHWQFAQMDQHPSDRFLSHSELAPLRVPLVPMEHCTSVFFQKCDDDKDKLVSFREWCSCFGIKEEDMDANLLF
ncbi:SPARC-like protein 1 [Triplophysa rosa]|uniref:SPARC-like protein 1 n=1 Tax=Triplophysa rosa TaxID=992332 RepID=A0A9W7X0E4_TRIRA|nr:SPARC-like protein 1 [Triplophysa rosa]KAI7811520.1 SPARC-like protein 1 precursor [Triplophysa rosa]